MPDARLYEQGRYRFRHLETLKETVNRLADAKQLQRREEAASRDTRQSSLPCPGEGHGSPALPIFENMAHWNTDPERERAREEQELRWDMTRKQNAFLAAYYKALSRYSTPRWFPVPTGLYGAGFFTPWHSPPPSPAVSSSPFCDGPLAPRPHLPGDVPDKPAAP